MSPQTGQEHELIESMPLLEWFANNYKKFGATLEIVTDKSQEGSQFVKGFGGIGGKLQEENVFVIFSGWFDNLVPTQVGLLLFQSVMKPVQETIVFTRLDSFPVQQDDGPCWALSLSSCVPQSLCPLECSGVGCPPVQLLELRRAPSCLALSLHSGLVAAPALPCPARAGALTTPGPVPAALGAVAHLSELPCTLLPDLLLLSKEKCF